MFECGQAVMIFVMLEIFGDCSWEGKNSDGANIECLILVAAGLVTLSLASHRLTCNLNQMPYNACHLSPGRWQVRENEWISLKKQL